MKKEGERAVARIAMKKKKEDSSGNVLTGRKAKKIAGFKLASPCFFDGRKYYVLESPKLVGDFIGGYYEAMAVREGDEITDGIVPTYVLHWTPRPLKELGYRFWNGTVLERYGASVKEFKDKFGMLSVCGHGRFVPVCEPQEKSGFSTTCLAIRDADEPTEKDEARIYFISWMESFSDIPPKATVHEGWDVVRYRNDSFLLQQCYPQGKSGIKDAALQGTLEREFGLSYIADWENPIKLMNHHANQSNPNNSANRAAANNHSNQCNPNNAAHHSSRGK